MFVGCEWVKYDGLVKRFGVFRCIVGLKGVRLELDRYSDIV